MNFEDDISRKTIAVVGASGYIGTSLVSRIEKSKARIIRVSRRPLSPKKMLMIGLLIFAISLVGTG